MPRTAHRKLSLKAEPDWYREPGEFVEIRSAGQTLYRGRVDTAMPDGSGLWLEAQGLFPRTYVHKETVLTMFIEE